MVELCARRTLTMANPESGLPLPVEMADQCRRGPTEMWNGRALQVLSSRQEVVSTCV